MIKSPDWFDFPMACLGALVSGVLVAWINIEHGYLLAISASLKQAFYAFCATGLLLQFCRRLAAQPRPPFLAMTLAVLVPLLLTMTLLYGVHSLKGTPEPLYSIIPGTVLSFIGLMLIAWRTVRGTRPPAVPPIPARPSAPQDS